MSAKKVVAKKVFCLADCEAETLSRYKDKLATCVQDIDLDFDYLVKKAKEAQQADLTELLEKIVKVVNTYQRDSAKVKGCEDDLVAHLRVTDMNDLAEETRNIGFMNVHELLTNLGESKSAYEEAVDKSKIELKREVIAHLKNFNSQLFPELIKFTKKKRGIGDQERLIELLQSSKALLTTKKPLKPDEEKRYEACEDKYIECIHDAHNLYEWIKMARDSKKDLSNLLSPMAQAKHTYANSVAQSKAQYEAELAAYLKAVDSYSLSGLVIRAKKDHKLSLCRLVEIIINAHQTVTVSTDNLKELKECLQELNLEEMIKNARKLEVSNIGELLTSKISTKHMYREEDILETGTHKIVEELAVCLTSFDSDLGFFLKKIQEKKIRGLSEHIVKLINAHQTSTLKDNLEAHLQSLEKIARKARRAIFKNLDLLLSKLADAKHTYEDDFKKILPSAMKALKYYEEEVKKCCLQDTNLLQGLVQDACNAKLIPKIIKDIYWSVHCDIPFQLRCRYLMLHVYKEIAKDHDSFDKWLSLLSKFKEINSVLGYIKMHYRREMDLSNEESLRLLTPDFMFEENHVRILINTLADCSSCWEKIAISLGLLENDIRNIRSMLPNYDADLCLYQVINLWVMQKHEHTIPPTLKNLQNALRSAIVGLGAKANDLKEDILKHDILQPKVQPRDGSPIQTEDEQILKILDQSQDTTITEGEGYVLLGIRVHSKTSSEALTYQWSKDGEKLKFDDDDKQSHRYHGSEEYIISILCDSLTVEGSYTCEIKQGDHVIVTEPVILTIRTPLDQYRENLNALYTEQPEVPEDTWPPVSIETFINLALIKPHGINNAGEYTHYTIRGDADDIIKDKEKIEYKSIFDRLGSGTRLLIEGRPGSGKTTLVHKVCKDWGKGQLKFKHIRLLFLVHLRSFLSDPNIKLHNILESYFSNSAVMNDIEKYADKHNGLGFCFILDGLDEYSPKKKDTYILNLITKKSLLKAVVLVVSRPVAVADIRKFADKKIEVLGFLKEQISEYIKQYNFSDESKCSELLKYLDYHPNVHHMCYLPIHTAMVCYLCDKGRSLPETETGIYKEFTICFFLRTLRKEEENIYIDSIQALPPSEEKSYKQICKLAFETTKSSKQVMKQCDVENFDVHSDRDCLGLITVDKVTLKYGSQKLYTFLHLTFQEFLTAYHISDLKEDKQTELIREYGNAEQMQIVWKFYCGLVKFDGNKFEALFNRTRYGVLYKIQCSFESQQPSTCDSIIEDGSLSFKDKFLTPSDFTAIAFVISHATQGSLNRLVFDECTLAEEGVNILIKKTGNNLSLVTTLCFHGHNCAAEQLKLVNHLMHALPSLKILDITNTQLGEEAVQALTCDLNHPKLQMLKIDSRSDNPLYSSNDLPRELIRGFMSQRNSINVWFSDHSTKYLSPFLPIPFYFCSIGNLFDMNMSFCELRLLEIQILSDDLKKSSVCTRVSLIGCNITDEGAKTLSYALRSSNIEILELNINLIGNEGAQALAHNIKSCLSLHTLDLSCNNIGDDGAMVIANALPMQNLATFKLFLWNN